MPQSKTAKALHTLSELNPDLAVKVYPASGQLVLDLPEPRKESLTRKHDWVFVGIDIVDSDSVSTFRCDRCGLRQDRGYRDGKPDKLRYYDRREVLTSVSPPCVAR